METQPKVSSNFHWVYVRTDTVYNGAVFEAFTWRLIWACYYVERKSLELIKSYFALKGNNIIKSKCSIAGWRGTTLDAHILMAVDLYPKIWLLNVQKM